MNIEPLSEEELRQLEALEAKATAAPWTPCEHWKNPDCSCGTHRGYLWAPDGERVILQMGCETDEAGQSFPSPEKQESRTNIHMISQARNALSSLIAEVRRHREAAKVEVAAAPAPASAEGAQAQEAAPEAGCSCHLEAGDSECFVHGADECGTCGSKWVRIDPSWRYNGKGWEHKCPGNHPQAGHFRANGPPAPFVPAATPTPADWYRSLSDLLSYWLLRAHQARVREGWEEGPTEEETFDRVLDVLSNLELDPHIHKKAVAEMLARPEQCWIHAPTAPAPRTYAEGFADAREMAAQVAYMHGETGHAPDCDCPEEHNLDCICQEVIAAEIRALKPGGES